MLDDRSVRDLDVAPPDAGALVARLAGLPDLSTPQLKAAWRAAWGTVPPKGARRRFLMLGIAWKWQARIHGGIPPALGRRLSALGRKLATGGSLAEGDLEPASPALLPGARLLRVWQGERHEVHVTETGFLWRGRSFASLSAIAREITGNRRNGPAFFGLRNGTGRKP